MNRQNLNYNYTYTLSPNSRQKQPHSCKKPHSTSYITSIKPLYQLNDQQYQKMPQTYKNYIHQQKYPCQLVTAKKFYPITNDDQVSNINLNKRTLYNNNLSQQNESQSSFYVNTSNNKFSRTGINNNNQFTLLKTVSTTNDIINQNYSEVQMMMTTTQSAKFTHNKNFKEHQIFSTNNCLKDQQNIQNYKQNFVNQHIEKYMNWLYEAFGQFEKTGNPWILKEINQKNSTQTFKLFSQLYTEKEISATRNPNDIQQQQNRLKTATAIKNNPSTKINNNSPTVTAQIIPTYKSNQILFKLKQQIFQIDKQSSIIQSKLKLQYQNDKQFQQELIQQMEIQQGHNLNQSQIRQQNHLKQMQQSIFQLQEQIKNIERKNTQIAKSISTLPFLKQWNLMFEQAKGATKLALKLKHQIQKKQELIKQLTNEDPSNTSDARSIKRGSQNGDHHHSNFTKKDNKVFNNNKNNTNDPASIPKPMTPVRPSSQISYKPNQKPQSGRSSNDVIIRHLSHSNRFSQSKKSIVNNSVERNRQRKQSYDQKQHLNNQTTQWKGLAFPTNLKNFGVGFIGKDVYK